MNKRKILSLALAVIMMLAACSVSVYGAETEGAYAYKYEGEAEKTSSHHFTFRWMRGDKAWEKVRNRHHAANIFRLTKTGSGETSRAYCADFITSAVAGTSYKRVNLEDSTYYNDAAARHIRGIMDKGYWYDWTSADLKSAENAANSWLASYDPSDFSSDAYLPGDAEEDVEKITGLTADEALLATQLAVWAFANTEGDGFWVDFFESFTTEEEGVYDYGELPGNVKSFRKYLIHQQARSADAEEILFSDNYFVKDTVVFSGKVGERTKYDLALKIRLAVPVEERDDLALSVKLADRDAVKVDLTDAKPDSRGYYTVNLKGVTAEEASKGADLYITGSQYAEGVYFYQPESSGDVRDASQNLVGKAAGMTPVSAKASMELAIGERTVALYKTDSETGKGLPGGEFSLYSEVSGDEMLVFSGLTTDEEGRLVISGLPEGYNYYFVETKAPAGYEISEGKIAAESTPDGEAIKPVYVANTKADPGPDDPDNPGSDDNTQTGDGPWFMISIAVMAAALIIMGAAVRFRRQQ